MLGAFDKDLRERATWGSEKSVPGGETACAKALRKESVAGR